MQRRLFRACLRAALAAVFLSAAIGARAQTGAAGANTGSRIYAVNCATCHQVGGRGVADAFPPLAGHLPDLLKPADGRIYVEKVLLFGLKGKISVNGGSYDGAMPDWQDLSDNDIAAVLNYVSSAWGGDKSLPAGFTPFTADEIKALRPLQLSAAAVHALRPGPQGGEGASAAIASGAAATLPPSFTAEQVASGAEIYARRCADCHGSTLDNGEFGGAPLNGSYFKQHWGGGTVAGLVAYARAKMPPDRPGSLTDQNYADLTAFLLDANGYPKGDTQLPPDTPSQQAMSLKRGQ